MFPESFLLHMISKTVGDPKHHLVGSQDLLYISQVISDYI